MIMIRYGTDLISRMGTRSMSAENTSLDNRGGKKRMAVCVRVFVPGNFRRLLVK